MKLSGVSSDISCIIYGDHYKARIYEQYGRIHYTINKKRNWRINPVLLFFPFLDLLFFAAPYIRTFVQEHFPVIQDVNSYLLSLPEWVINAAAIAFSVALLGFCLFYVYKVRTWHGCEHKLIAATEDNRIFDAKEYSPIAERCGTTYVLSMFITVAASFALFNMVYFTLIFIVMVIESKFFHKYNTPGIYVGKKIQKYNAVEPEMKKLHVGMKAMRELAAKEMAYAGTKA